MNLIDAQRKISVSKSHNYTKEKVLMAEKLLAEWGANQRNFPSQKIIEVYNAIKGTNVAESACKSCNGSRFLIGIQNYAKYGRMVLLNEGVVLDEIEEVKHQPQEIAPERIDTGIIEEVKEVAEPEPITEEPVEPAPKKKTTKKK